MTNKTALSTNATAWWDLVEKKNPTGQNELPPARRQLVRELAHRSMALLIPGSDAIIEALGAIATRVSAADPAVPPPLPNPSGAPINKLMGKEWIPIAFERRANELSRLGITQAGRKLADESKTASDCRKPVSTGYCTNELRKLGVWKPQPRQSPKQHRSR